MVTNGMIYHLMLQFPSVFDLSLLWLYSSQLYCFSLILSPGLFLEAAASTCSTPNGKLAPSQRNTVEHLGDKEMNISSGCWYTELK